MLFNDTLISPESYEAAAVIAHEAGDSLLSRLDWMTITPSVILDVGCGAGLLSQKLKTHYPNATVISIDQSENMLRYAQQKNSVNALCAEAETLPFLNNSVDILIANFLLPWHANPKALFAEWQRVLRPNGLLLFSGLGPDTLQEYHAIFADYLPQLIDMHDIGDELVQAGFSDPVLEVEHYTLTYRDQVTLLRELQESGLVIGLPLVDLLQPNEEEIYSLTCEVVFAHAWKQEKQSSTSSDGTTHISLASLRRQLRGDSV